MEGDSEELNLESAVIDKSEIDHTLNKTIKQASKDIKQTLSSVKSMIAEINKQAKIKESDIIKNLANDVKKRQSFLIEMNRNSELFKAYRQPFTFQKREKLTDKNYNEFVSYVAREENKIKQQQKEEAKRRNELLKLEKQKAKEEEQKIKEQMRMTRKIASIEKKAFSTAFNTAQNLIKGGALSVVGVGKQAINMYSPYVNANKYGLLVNRNKKFDNSLIARARYSPYITPEEVSGELSNYYEKQWHFKTRKQEINPHLHRLNLSSENNVEDVLKRINQVYQGEGKEIYRRQMARDVGLEATYLASLEKKTTEEEKYVAKMEEAQKAFLEFKGSLRDIVAETLPTFVKGLNYVKENFLQNPKKTTQSIVSAVSGLSLIKQGVLTGIAVGAGIGGKTGILGAIAGGAVGGIAGGAVGAAGAYGIGKGASELLFGNSGNEQIMRKVNSDIPTMREVANRTDSGGTNITVNFNGSVYRPEEITSLMENVAQNALENNEIQKSVLNQTP